MVEFLVRFTEVAITVTVVLFVWHVLTELLGTMRTERRVRQTPVSAARMRLDRTPQR